MRQIRTSGSMSGEWNRSMVGYSGTGTRKSRQHARPHLNHRATPRLYFVMQGGRWRTPLFARANVSMRGAMLFELLTGRPPFKAATQIGNMPHGGTA